MEVVLDRDAFLKGLQMVQNIVEPRQTLPILANVLLETDGETVRLTATDLEVGARVTVPARVTSKGAITISARKLSEIVKELPAATLTLKVNVPVTLVNTADGTRYTLTLLPQGTTPSAAPAAAGADTTPASTTPASTTPTSR